jgi:peroxiredoxin
MNYFLVAGSLLGFILLASLSLLGWQLLRQNGRILLRLDELEKRLNELEFGGADEPAGLPLDSLAPDFDLPDLAGERKTLAQYRGQTVLLIFYNPACGFCRELAPKLAALTRPADALSHPMGEGSGEGRPLPVIISTGEAETNRMFFGEHKVGCPVLLQTDGEVSKAYQARGTPSGYLIDSESRIASELALGAEAALALVFGASPQPSALNPEPASSMNGNGRENRFSNRSLARSKIKRDGLKAGTLAPDFRLPRLDGRGDLALSELRGKRVLLVFSSPHCGPCNALAPELEKFHREQRNSERILTPTGSLSDGERQSSDGISVVMISKAEPKENRAKVKEHGLTFPIVLQQQWEVSRRYAMFATPIAYMVDQAGIISHDVAVGVESIQTLLAKVATGPLEARLV